jgi:lysophospholipase L1-like esterase
MSRWRLCYCVLVAVAALTALAVSDVQASVSLGKIMPLGDSITAGNYVSGGYRAPLYDLLQAGGYTSQYVGTQTTWPTTGLTTAHQINHEGHSGYIIEQDSYGFTRSGIADNIAGWIGPYYENPDIILLMIGTNDMYLNFDVANAPARLSHLISLISDKVTGLCPNAKLYVASLTPSTNSAAETRIRAFNAALPGLIAQHQSLGENVYFVNMHDALNTGMLSDELHPNQQGYNVMAQTWYNAITPEPASIALLGCGALIGLRRRTRR